MKLMAIKMRVLMYPGKGKFKSIAGLIKSKYDLAINSVDTIPPAYSCDKERIVILILSLGRDIPNDLRLFLREMTKLRSYNTAIITDCKEDTIKKVRALLIEGGTNIIDNVLYIKGGLPIFSKVSEEEEKALSVWIEEVVANLK